MLVDCCRVTHLVKSIIRCVVRITNKREILFRVDAGMRPIFQYPEQRLRIYIVITHPRSAAGWCDIAEGIHYTQEAALICVLFDQYTTGLRYSAGPGVNLLSVRFSSAAADHPQAVPASTG